MSKYFKNFILCGDIDHHCLLCKESFQSVDDLEKHIRWEKHRKSIKSLTPMPKFKKDSIYKIDEKFYCEHCNYVLPSIPAISKHFEEASHKENKTNPLTALKSRGCRDTVCKRESGSIVIGKTKITNKEWYGVIDQRCIFCDVAVDHFVKHISLSGHMINMIQSQILTKEEQHYRKINEERCYCFLCMKTFSAQSLNEHWIDKLHLEKAEAQNGKDTKADRDKKLDVAIKLINSQKDNFDIDLDNRVATCKICTAYVNINFKFMIEHKKTHNITDKDKIEQAALDVEAVLESLKKPDDPDSHTLRIYDHGKQRAELAKFGRDNFIKLVFPGAKGYCSLCGIYISAHMNNFNEHVRGHIHMGHLELKGLDKSGIPHIKPTYKTKKLKDHLKSVVHAKDLNVLWVNKQHCVDIFCFMLLSMIDEKGHGKKVKCHACDTIYDHDKDKEHCQTEKHKEVFLNSEVILSIKGEFIREIRPYLYHCGVCNLTFPFWETLEKHLQSWKHVFTKDDKSPMHKLTEQWYGGLTSPSLNHERVYAHLMNLGFM